MKNSIWILIMLLNTAFANAAGTDSFVHVILQPVNGADSSCQYVFKTTGCNSGSIILNAENRSSLLPKELPASTWSYSTDGCNEGTTRSFLKFNTLISSIPPTAVVDSVFLNLYGVSSSLAVTAGNSYYPGSPYNSSGANTLTVSRVLSSWNRTTLTWNNQPAVSSSNTATIPPSTSQWGYDAKVNVTDMVRDMIMAGASYGFMLKEQTESMYKSMVFCSAYADDTMKIPTLSVYYHVQNTNAIHDINNSVFDSKSVVLYPVPALNELNVSVLSNKVSKLEFKLFDLSGKLVQQLSLPVVAGSNTLNINTSNLSQGCYILSVGDGSVNVYRQFSKI